MTSSATTQLTDLTILSLRQTIGSLEFTATQLSDQGMDDLRVFMKDVGTSRNVNPVEMIYASFPAFLYLNATLAGQLLVPLLEFQSSVSYNLDYAAPDLGSNWPKVLGKNTGSGSVDSSRYGTCASEKIGRWEIVIYLLRCLPQVGRFFDNIHKVNWIAHKSPTADGLLGATSNSMLNSIMGIYAMGQINKVLEAVGADSSLTSHYLDTARSFAQKWKESVLDSDWHPYGNNASWGLLYNLYAPRMLGADIIPEQIYELQAGWCSNQSAKVQSTQPYGLSYEGNQSVTVKAHWTLLTAGSIVNSTISDARDVLLSTVHARSFMKTGQNANPSTYSAIDGSLINGTASPAMGAAFAFLALGLPDLAIKLPFGSLKSSTTSRATNRVPAIVGGVLGGIAVILLVFLYLRQRRGKIEEDQDFPVTPFTSEFNHEESESDQPEDAPRLVSSPVRQPQKLIPHRSKYLSSIRTKNHAKVDLESSSSIAGSSTRTPAQDDDLRREVEQLRIVVEALREEQVAPPQFVDQDVPNEPPPGYGTLTQ